MPVKIFAVALLGFCLVSNMTLADQIATADGIGPVKIGMSVKQVQHALKAKLKARDRYDGEDCWYTTRTGKVDPFIYYMVEDGKITRIDIQPKNDSVSPVPKLPVATPEGIGVGSSEADIRKAYGEVVKKERGPYDDEDTADTQYWLHVDTPDKKLGMVFITQQEHVLYFWIGTHEAINRIEGCS
jgi:hypothetical protein